MKQAFSLLFLLISVLTFGQLKVKDNAPLTTKNLRAINDTLYNLNDFKKEKGLVVIFSCNSCPFVVGSDDFPGWEKQYNALHETAQLNQIGMVLVNSNEGKRAQADSFDEMLKHAQEMKYTLPYLLDENSELADAFGARTTPHVYFFDENFTLIYTGSIDNTWDNSRKADESYLYNAMVLKGAQKKIKTHTTEPKGCGIKRISSTQKH